MTFGALVDLLDEDAVARDDVGPLGLSRRPRARPREQLADEPAEGFVGGEEDVRWCAGFDLPGQYRARRERGLDRDAGFPGESCTNLGQHVGERGGAKDDDGLRGIGCDRMTVRYHIRSAVPDYVCQRESIEHGAPKCQSIKGEPVDTL